MFSVLCIAYEHIFSLYCLLLYIYRDNKINSLLCVYVLMVINPTSMFTCILISR